MIILLKKSPLVVILVVLMSVIVSEAAFFGRKYRAIERARGDYAAKLGELESFRKIVPAPTVQMAESISEDLIQAEDEWAELCGMLHGKSTFLDAPLEEGGTGQRAEAFFNLARFVDELRAMADSEGVQVRQNEYFGFSSYANMSPDAEVLECVLRQRQAMAHLLTMVFDARPTSLDSIRRERPRPAALSQSTAGGRPRGAPWGITNSNGIIEGGDFFSLDPRLSIRRSGQLNTLAFRIVFSGGTASLRSLLNELTDGNFAWFVCSVEVEPARSTTDVGALAGRKTASGLENNECVPVVREALSQFTVTVEIVEPSVRVHLSEITAS